MKIEYNNLYKCYYQTKFEVSGDNSKYVNNMVVSYDLDQYIWYGKYNYIYFISGENPLSIYFGEWVNNLFYDLMFFILGVLNWFGVINHCLFAVGYVDDSKTDEDIDNKLSKERGFFVFFGGSLFSRVIHFVVMFVLQGLFLQVAVLYIRYDGFSEKLVSKFKVNYLFYAINYLFNKIKKTTI